MEIAWRAMKARAGKLFHLLEKTFSEMAQYATEAELLQASSNKPKDRWKRNPNHGTTISYVVGVLL